jgi:hypothetical protein
MRDDMDRVVIERPRRWDYNKPADRETIRRNQRDPESAPLREPINVKRQKTPDDLLGPLKKFLTRQVGRPWTSVHSELSRVLPRNSRMNLHVWQHIEAYVQKSSTAYEAPYYVDTSGIFRKAKTSPRKRFKWNGEATPGAKLQRYLPAPVRPKGRQQWRYVAPLWDEILVYKISEHVQCWRIHNVWYRLEFGHVPTEHMTDGLLSASVFQTYRKLWGSLWDPAMRPPESPRKSLYGHDARGVLSVSPLCKRERITLLRGKLTKLSLPRAALHPHFFK